MYNPTNGQLNSSAPSIELKTFPPISWHWHTHRITTLRWTHHITSIRSQRWQFVLKCTHVCVGRLLECCKYLCQRIWERRPLKWMAHVSNYVHIHAYICTYIYTRLCACLCLHICMFVCKHRRIHKFNQKKTKKKSRRLSGILNSFPLALRQSKYALSQEIVVVCYQVRFITLL